MCMPALQALVMPPLRCAHAKGCPNPKPFLQVGHWPDLQPARHPEPAAGALLHHEQGTAAGQPLCLFGPGLQLCSQQAQQMDTSFLRIPPSQLRHIFVDERRSRQRVEGPDDAAAAQVMGNSTQASSKIYDLHFDVREAQAAVDAMQTWRQHLQAKQQPC